MIEVVLDFNEIEERYKKSDGKLSNITVLYFSEKLGLPYKDRVGKWDAFSDNFRDLLYKEWEEYRKEDGWKNYQEYLQEKEEDAKIGPKNEQGVRDDIRLVFVNFRPFLLRHERIACDLLHVMFFRLEEVNSDQWHIEGMMNKIEIYIKS